MIERGVVVKESFREWCLRTGGAGPFYFRLWFGVSEEGPETQ